MSFDKTRRQLERLAIHDPLADRQLKNAKLRAGADQCEVCQDPVDGTKRCFSCTWFFDPDYDVVSRFVSIDPTAKRVSFRRQGGDDHRVRFSPNRSVESAISILDDNQQILDRFIGLADFDLIIDAMNDLEDFIIDNVPFHAVPEDYMQEDLIAQDFLKFGNVEAMAAYWVALASDTCIIVMTDMMQWIREQAIMLIGICWLSSREVTFESGLRISAWLDQE